MLSLPPTGAIILPNDLLCLPRGQPAPRGFRPPRWLIAPWGLHPSCWLHPSRPLGVLDPLRTMLLDGAPAAALRPAIGVLRPAVGVLRPTAGPLPLGLFVAFTPLLALISALAVGGTAHENGK